MRRGVIPEQMEDKWFIYWKDGELYFHRSWTGRCIYVVKFESEQAGCRMIEALANRDHEQYQETSEERDKAMISFLIDVVLLHRLSRKFRLASDAAGVPQLKAAARGRLRL
jgi:hypothetical protein